MDRRLSPTWMEGVVRFGGLFTNEEGGLDKAERNESCVASRL